MHQTGDPVTPSADECKTLFERGFRTWSRHVESARKATTQESLDYLEAVDVAFPHHPTLPTDLKLERSIWSLLATGISSWATTTGSSSVCGPGLPIIPPQKREFIVTKKSPTRVTIKKGLETGYSRWFGDQNGHITILVLAWAYILSARWAELIPGAHSIRYTDSRADQSQKKQANVAILMEDMSKQAARWWQAVLAPGHGWLATVDSDGRTLHSPWSVQLSSGLEFAVLFPGLGHPSSSSVAADSTTALRYLSEYCSMHDLAGQSRAALSTVLCLPLTAYVGSRITLPAPRFTTSATALQQDQRQHAFPLLQVDKLLVVGCNTRGLEALLLSSFFDQDVPCNLVSPFLQGTFAALDAISHDRCLLTHALMERSPKVGFLWVGAILSGAHTHFLQLARYGSMDVDILSAAWNGTTQTFMQLPVSTGAQSGRIRREDECRLAYLASEEHQDMIPMSPWKPFGTTALKDAELDVQVHAKCKGHGLRYQGWAWDCWKDGRPGRVRHVHTGAFPRISQLPFPGNHTTIAVPYDKLDLDVDGASRKATLCIFMWLRRDGYPAAEQPIRQREWLRDVLDEEDEEANESWPEDEGDADLKKKGAKSSKTRPKLGRWLASTQTRRQSSI